MTAAAGIVATGGAVIATATGTDARRTAAMTPSRRALLAGLGAAGIGGRALAQSGGCRDGYGTARCPLPVTRATAPAPEVFAPTGWKTLALESITMDVVDYRREAGFYAALLGWT